VRDDAYVGSFRDFMVLCRAMLYSRAPIPNPGHMTTM